MHRDPTLRRRNALVIPGTLLVLVCLAGIVYAQGLRSDDNDCEDGRLVVFAGACRSASLLLAVPFAIGALLMGVGIAQRKRGNCHLGHGTTATTVLAVLVTIFVLPFLAAVGLHFSQDPDSVYVVTMYEVDFTLVRILATVSVIGLVALVPYVGLYVGTSRPPRCCLDKECFTPCFCDEEADAAEPWPPSEPATPVPTQLQLATPSWQVEAPPPLPPPAPPAPTPPPTLPPAAPSWPTPAPVPSTPPAEAAPAWMSEPVAEADADEPEAEPRPGKAKGKPAKKGTRKVTRKK